jgi:thymidylate synthase (FAD)
MWIEFLEGIRVWSPLAIELAQKFNQKYPFFAIPPGAESSDAQIIQFTVSLLDENPLTNRDKLSLEDMGKHMTLTARVVCDRSCSHQLVRNRLCSYSQTSQRYVNYSKKGFQYVKDPEISSLPEELQFAWEEHVKCGFKLYAGLTREGKLKPEKARTLLANCTATEVITTTTINQWKLMFKQRGHNKAAESQIRDIMLSGEKQFQEILPDVFTS